MHKKIYMPFRFFMYTHQEFLLPAQLNLCLYLYILDNLLLFKINKLFKHLQICQWQSLYNFYSK
jgi:hypothetical protein